MSDIVLNEFDRFACACSEKVYDAEWLGSIDTKLIGSHWTAVLVGIKPGRHATVSWSEDSGFGVKITKPDSYYSESNIATAVSVLSLVSLLGSD